MDGRQRLLHGRGRVLHGRHRRAVGRMHYSALRSRRLCWTGRATLGASRPGLGSRLCVGLRDPASLSSCAQYSLLSRRQSCHATRPPLTHTGEFGAGSLLIFRLGHLLDLFLSVRRRSRRRHVCEDARLRSVSVTCMAVLVLRVCG